MGQTLHVATGGPPLANGLRGCVGVRWVGADPRAQIGDSRHRQRQAAAPHHLLLPVGKGHVHPSKCTIGNADINCTRLFFPKALQKKEKRINKTSAQTAAFIDLSEHEVCLLGFPRPHTIKNQVCGAFSTLNIRHLLSLMATGSTTSWAALFHLPFFFSICLQNF